MRIKLFIPGLFLVMLFSCNQKNEETLQKVSFEGLAQGTYYTVAYFSQDGIRYQQQIDSLLDHLNTSVSIYESNSIVSRINRNESGVKADKIFAENFRLAQEVAAATSGAFDITIAPLINAWGFGLENKSDITEELLDSLKQFTGFRLIRMKDNVVVKKDPRIQLNFNAIAQGYAVDQIGIFLEEKGIRNYLIDIGGEVLGKGSKPDNGSWNVGIQTPTANRNGKFESQTVVRLKNKALATSGNYRTYYIEDSIKYSHTIDPFTGYPVRHSLLSVSVLAENAAMADAYATAFMVIGLDSAKKVLKKLNGIDAYFIFSENDKMETWYTTGFEDIIPD